jgi:hypothetical protein
LALADVESHEQWLWPLPARAPRRAARATASSTTRILKHDMTRFSYDMT